MEIALDWKSISSLLATIVFIRAAVRDFLPPELAIFIRTLLPRLLSSFHPTTTLLIDEFDYSSAVTNELFEAARLYLSARCLDSADVLRLYKTKYSKSITSSLPASHSTTDVFEGAEMRWSYHAMGRPSPSRSPALERRYFELSFHRLHKGMVQSRYVPYVVEEAARLMLKARERRLFTNRPGSYVDEFHGPHWYTYFIYPT